VVKETVKVVDTGVGSREEKNVSLNLAQHGIARKAAVVVGEAADKHGPVPVGRRRTCVHQRRSMAKKSGGIKRVYRHMQAVRLNGRSQSYRRRCMFNS
jgi:hypothetical protein